MHSANPKSKTEILKIAIPLFAREGFSGISMRRLADAVGFNAASLYHHFPDKETLYIATIKYAFADKARSLAEPLAMSVPPRERLKLLITRLCEQPMTTSISAVWYSGKYSREMKNGWN